MRCTSKNTYFEGFWYPRQNRLYIPLPLLSYFIWRPPLWQPPLACLSRSQNSQALSRWRIWGLTRRDTPRNQPLHLLVRPFLPPQEHIKTSASSLSQWLTFPRIDLAWWLGYGGLDTVLHGSHQSELWQDPSQGSYLTGNGADGPNANEWEISRHAVLIVDAKPCFGVEPLWINRRSHCGRYMWSHLRMTRSKQAHRKGWRRHKKSIEDSRRRITRNYEHANEL